MPRAVEPVDDRQALDDRVVPGHQHGHEPLCILGQIGVAALIACDQADLDPFIIHAFQVQRDADAIAG
jgi:hypothetical protein